MMLLCRWGCGEGLFHPDLRDRHALRRHLASDCPQASPLRPQRAHPLDGLLLLGHRHQFAVVAGTPAPGHLAAQVAPADALVAFDLGDPLAGPIALSFGNGGQDGEHQLADATSLHLL